MPETTSLNPEDDCSTLEVARWLGMAVRSVQLMVDRGELEAWKTPGGHRRIARASVERWLRSRGAPSSAPETLSKPAAQAAIRTGNAPRVLLIEDSAYFQNLVGLLVQEHLPQVELHVAQDGIVGLAMCGQLQPQVLIVDILLPGIDGATLITSLRSQPQFANSQLIVITSLNEEQRAPYAFALRDVPVIHKPRLALELPELLKNFLSSARVPPLHAKGAAGSALPASIP
ncbi:MAG: response regulator [Burkholderiaceae bacterium]|nr:response regulator [Roseateles sp.]MBV8470286.1 response regulator [Burkholderiaceae bacterium]